MRPTLTSLGRRLPELAVELSAIADGIDANDVRAIERARRIADRSLRQLCDEAGIPSSESATNLIDALLAKHAMPHTIAAHLRVLYDPESTLVGDAARALVAFLEWRVGSRSRLSAMPARRSKLPLILGAAIAVVGVAIAIVATRSSDPLPPPPIASGPMVKLAGATFEMGSTDLELSAALAYCRDVDHRNAAACADDKELLAQEQLRRVTVSAFEIDQHEVTIGEFVSWLASHPRAGQVFPNTRVDAEGHTTPAPGKDQLPIAGVNWDDARQYCADVGKRLPTEAEWELAARGPSRRVFPWGSEPPSCSTVIYARELDRSCWLGTNGDAAPVATAAGDVTPEGVHDLGGNVAEWTADAGGARPQCSGPCVDPKVTDGITRVIRGGHWGSWSGQLRAAGRYAWPPATVRTVLGFRCAR